MELKQLEFFAAAYECGSLSRAAVKLYTSQPNVSKVIASLENELGSPLFERTSRGIKPTEYGKSIYDYAFNILVNADLIIQKDSQAVQNNFSISTYPSNMLAKLLVTLYQNHPGMVMRHFQGTVEEVTNHVSQSASELGVLYVSKKQLTAFRHAISHKKLEFVELGRKEACLYVGPRSPLYDKKSVTLEELTRLRFSRGLSGYFSMEHHLEQIHVGAVNEDQLHPVVYTNSEHFQTNLLLKTDLVELGINLVDPDVNQYDTRNLRIEGEDAYLIFGYVVEKKHVLSEIAKEFVEQLKGLL